MNNKTHFMVGTVWYYIAIILSCLLIENFGLFSYSALDGMSNNSFFLLTILILGINAFYFINLGKTRRLSFDKILFPVLIILGILFSISIWKQTNQTLINSDGEEPYIYEIVFSNMDKLRATVSLWIGILAIYGILFVVSRINLRNRSLSWVYLVLIGVGIISTFGSLITDFEAYKSILKGTNPGTGVKFLYFNENYYGFFTMLSILSCVAYSYYHSKWYINVCLVILCVELFFTSCASALYPTSIMVFLYVIYRLIVGLKKKPIRYSIYWGIFVFITFSLAIAYALYVEKEGTLMFNIHKYLSGDVINKDMKTFSNRTNVWNTAFDIIKDDTWSIIFGHGFKTSNEILKGHMMANSKGVIAIHSCHSSYIEIMLRYGVVGFVFYVFGFLYLIYCLIHLLIKKQSSFAINYGICLIILAAYCTFESYPFFTSNFSGMLLTLLFAMPIIRSHKIIMHPSLNIDIYEHKINKQMDSRLLNYLVSSFILSFILVVVLSFIPSKGKSNPEVLSLMISLLIIGLAANIFVPYVVMLWHKNNNNRFILRILLNSLIYLIGVTILIFAKFYVKSFTSYFYPTLIICSISFFIFEFLLYSLMFGWNIKEWLSLLFGSFFKMNLMPIILTSVIGAIFLSTCNFLLTDYFAFNICLIFILFIYFVILNVLPNNFMNHVKIGINDYFLRKEVKLIEKDAI